MRLAVYSRRARLMRSRLLLPCPQSGGRNWRVLRSSSASLSRQREKLKGVSEKSSNCWNAQRRPMSSVSAERFRTLTIGHLCFSQTAYAAESAPAETGRSSKARGQSIARLRRPVLLGLWRSRSAARDGERGSQAGVPHGCGTKPPGTRAMRTTRRWARIGGGCATPILSVRSEFARTTVRPSQRNLEHVTRLVPNQRLSHLAPGRASRTDHEHPPFLHK